MGFTNIDYNKVTFRTKFIKDGPTNGLLQYKVVPNEWDSWIKKLYINLFYGWDYIYCPVTKCTSFNENDIDNVYFCAVPNKFGFGNVEDMNEAELYNDEFNEFLRYQEKNMITGNASENLFYEWMKNER